MPHTQEFDKDFGGQSAAIARAIEQASGGQVKTVRTLPRNEDEADLLQSVNDVHDQMAEVGVLPGSLINMHPWEIKAQGPYYMGDSYTVKACPIGTAFVHHVFSSYIVDAVDKAGKYQAKPITPITIANDFVRQHSAQKRGGLWAYLGGHAPFSNQSTKEKEERLFKEARQTQIRCYRKMHQDAQLEFHRPNKVGWVNITPNHQLAAQWLIYNKFLSKAPEWLSIERDGDFVQLVCPMCKAEANDGAVICTACRYIIDPFALAKAGELDEDDPVHMRAMRRCTREQLDALGLKDVQTLAEVREDRKRELEGETPSRAKGKGKNAKAVETEE